MRRPASTDLALGMVAAVVGLVILFSAVAGPASSMARVDTLARQVRCPTCAGLSIADSPATMASQMRAVVAVQVEAGASDDEVRAFFVDRYGRWILLDPPVSGIDIVVWLVPVLLLSAGLVLVVARARSAGSPSEPVRPVLRGRWVTAAAVSFAVIAVAAPVVVAVGPRLAGTEITGRSTTTDITSLEARAPASPDDMVARTALATRTWRQGARRKRRSNTGPRDGRCSSPAQRRRRAPRCRATRCGPRCHRACPSTGVGSP